MADNNNQQHLMATAKQIAANRANALASTGPRTKAGKKISSQNALAHGTDREGRGVPWEAAAVFEAFRSTGTVAAGQSDHFAKLAYPTSFLSRAVQR